MKSKTVWVICILAVLIIGLVVSSCAPRPPQPRGSALTAIPLVDLRPVAQTPQHGDISFPESDESSATPASDKQPGIGLNTNNDEFSHAQPGPTPFGPPPDKPVTPEPTEDPGGYPAPGQ